jgi:hypothetical protein
MSNRHPLNAKDLSKLRPLFSQSKNVDLICSSYLEFAPWYRYNYGFLIFSLICGISLKPKDVLRVLKSCFFNLLCSSKIGASIAPGSTPSSHVVFTWLLDFSDSRDKCLRRYYGSLADDPDFKGRHLWVISQSKPPIETLKRLNSEGVSVLWHSSPNILDVCRAIVYCLARLNPLLFIDVEFWKGEQIANIFVNWLQKNQVIHPHIMLPYEQQPWQLRIILKVKRVFGSNSTIVGDLHTSITNFPSQFIKTRLHPDQIIIHGNAYKMPLIELLGWKESDIAIQPSRRFTKKLQYESSIIALPYVMTSYLDLIRAVAAITQQNPSIAKWELLLHPARQSDTKYLKQAEFVRHAMERINDTIMADGKPIVLVYGVSTLIFEALESGYEVYNFIESDVIDVYPSDIWPDLHCEALTPNLLKYTLSKANSFVIYDKRFI